jgi:hypothetical protein
MTDFGFAAIRVLLLAAATAFNFAPASARAAENTAETLLPKSDDEILAEAAQITGLTQDALKSAVGSDPKLLGVLSDQIAALRVVNNLANADDKGAALLLADIAAGKLRDKLITGPLGAALTGFTVYKTALEVYREAAYLPALHDDLYQKYKDARARNCSDSEAFEESTLKSRHYFEMKEGMVRDYYKAKGMNQELAGDRLDHAIRRSMVDQYWIARMEAKYRQETLKKNEARIRKELTDQMLAKIKATRPGKPAGQPEASPEKLAEDLAAVARFKAAVEADAVRMTRQYPNCTYKIAWLVEPKLENGKVCAAWDLKLLDAGNPSPEWRVKWQTPFTRGSMEAPFEWTISEIRARYPAPKPK